MFNNVISAFGLKAVPPDTHLNSLWAPPRTRMLELSCSWQGWWHWRMLVKVRRRAEGTGLHVSSYGYKGNGMGNARACTCVGTSFFSFPVSGHAQKNQ